MKPVIVGLNNPYSARPESALLPFPDNSAGHRLWKMLGEVEVIHGGTNRIDWSAFRASYDKSHYADAFDRRNLFRGPVPTKLAERMDAACAMAASFPEGSTVILLGREVADCFSPALSAPLQKILIHPQVIDGVTWRMLPHPSGRNTIFNDPAIRMLAGMVLADVLTYSAAKEKTNATE